MKTRIHFLFVLCGAFFLQAQGQNKECEEKTAEIHAFINENKLSEAFESWSKAGNCAYASESVLLDGEKILRYKIEAATTDNEKSDAVSGLVKLYDTYDQKFPGNTNSNLSKRATLLNDYKLGNPGEAYSLLDKAFKSDPSHFTDAAAIYLYFDLFVGKFKAGEKGITEDDVLVRYDVVSAKLEQESLRSTAESRAYQSAMNGIKALVSPFATCEKLMAFYGKNFEAKKTDTIWLQRASGSLMEKNCTTSPLFLKIATESYTLKATPKSAYFLGMAYMKNRDQKKAVSYFDMASSLETNADEKAKIYYTTASMVFLDKAKSLDYLKKALAAKPSFGKAYLLMAQIYTQSPTCAKTPFERKALYLLAAETAKKAALDPSLQKSAASVSESYLKKGPTRQEIKDEKKGGQTITFGCYINESVIIPE